MRHAAGFILLFDHRGVFLHFRLHSGSLERSLGLHVYTQALGHARTRLWERAVELSHEITHRMADAEKWESSDLWSPSVQVLVLVQGCSLSGSELNSSDYEALLPVCYMEKCPTPVQRDQNSLRHYRISINSTRSTRSTDAWGTFPGPYTDMKPRH